MYAHRVSVHLKPDSTAAFTQRLEQQVIPMLRKQKGFQDEITFVGAGAEAFGVSLWDDKESADIRYYISSLKVGVKRFARAVRGHWGVENTCHWTLDMTFREDESRIRGPQIRENFAWLNRLALSLLKQHPSKDSIAMKRQICGWDDAFLLEVLTGIMG